MEGQQIFQFDGSTYNPEADHDRLKGQWLRVFALMKDGQWRTLGEISFRTGDPESSVSARLRDFRKERFGGHVVERRHRSSEDQGYYEYRLVIRKNLGGNQ